MNTTDLILELTNERNRAEKERDAWRDAAERMSDCLEFIEQWGGKTHDTECGPISCNGSWCSTQAGQARLEFIKSKLNLFKEGK